MHKIYMVEDDENIGELVKYALGTSGLDTAVFESGRLFWESYDKAKPDIILLDIMLPGEDGVDILTRLRERKSDVPVIMLTAKSSELDKVRALNLGADDYMTKPFSVVELTARIQAVLRRTGKAYENFIVGDIEIDTPAVKVTVSGKVTELTRKEYELLLLMARNKGRVVTRDTAMNIVWGYDYEGESRTIDMHIKTLRSKLLHAGEQIKTVRGVGYKLEEI